MASGRPIAGAQPAFEIHNRFSGDRLNRYVNENWSNKVGDLPSGYGFSGGAIVPALKVGGLSSYVGDAIIFSQSGTIISAMTLIGPSSFSIVGTGGLSLIITLIANGAFTFSQTGAINLTIGLSGSGTWSISPSGGLNLIIPVSGDAEFSITTAANLKGYAGLSGDITPFTELSPENLAAAVWNAAASSFDGSGSMGQKLNAAGTAGDPWTQSLPGAYAEGTAGYILGTSSGLSTTQIAEAVWDEALSGHATSGSAGAALTSAASGGSGGLTVEEHNALITTSNIVGSNLDSQVSSIPTTTGLTLPQFLALK